MGISAASLSHSSAACLAVALPWLPASGIYLLRKSHHCPGTSDDDILQHYCGMQKVMIAPQPRPGNVGFDRFGGQADPSLNSPERHCPNMLDRADLCLTVYAESRQGRRGSGI